MPSRVAAVPPIWRTCAEWAEAGWLAARGRGISDPVVELWADLGCVAIAVAERERMAHQLGPGCPSGVASPRSVPPGR